MVNFRGEFKPLSDMSDRDIQEDLRARNGDYLCINIKTDEQGSRNLSSLKNFSKEQILTYTIGELFSSRGEKVADIENICYGSVPVQLGA